MERRIAYQTGIRAASRRRSLTDASVFFEIFDDPTAPAGQVGKRWRLHAPPTGTGPVVLGGPVWRVFKRQVGKEFMRDSSAGISGLV